MMRSSVIWSEIRAWIEQMFNEDDDVVKIQKHWKKGKRENFMNKNQLFVEFYCFPFPYSFV